MGKYLKDKGYLDKNCPGINLLNEEKNYFRDVDVPKIVQVKADMAFSKIKVERENEMKKNIKNNSNTLYSTEQNTLTTRGSFGMKRKAFTRLLIGTAACAVVAVVAANGSWWRFDTDKKSDTEADIASEADKDVVVSAMDNMFTLRAEAAELTKKQPVPVIDLNPTVDNDAEIQGKTSRSWGMGAAVEDGVMDYCINMPLSCIGNNIEKITYSINNGAFQIVQPEDESIIIDGKLYEKELNTGSIGGDYDEENGTKPSRNYETVLYQSFTLDYQKQSDAYTWINICNERSGCEEAIDLIWGDGEKSIENDNLAMHQMLEGTIITCTIQYADGTTQTAEVLVDTQIMTYAEAGEESANGDADDKSVYVTFELQ